MSEFEEHHHHKETSHQKIGRIIEALVREWFQTLKPEEKERMNPADFKEGAYIAFRTYVTEHRANLRPRNELNQWADDLRDASEEDIEGAYYKSAFNPDKLFLELTGRAEQKETK